MEKQFVTPTIALELKELGFDEECLAYRTTGSPVTLDKNGDKTNFILLSSKTRGELVGHGTVKNSLFDYLKNNDLTCGELYTLSNSITAPIWQQAIDWIRKEHKLHIFIDIWPTDEEPDRCWYMIRFLNRREDSEKDSMSGWFNSQYEAREQAILKAIELIKNNI